MMTVATIMQTEAKTVSPDMTLTQLEQRFLETGFSGFPVVDEGKLVGVVSRSDIVKSILTERSRIEQLSDFYSSSNAILEPSGDDASEASLDAIAAQVGIRMNDLRVRDLMAHDVIRTECNETLPHLATFMLEGGFHRLPVVDGERLVGVVTSMDIVRAVAEGLLVATGGAPAELPPRTSS